MWFAFGVGVLGVEGGCSVVLVWFEFGFIVVVWVVWLVLVWFSVMLVWV